MTYTPINWQTGDTITAEKLNKMDNGWGVQEAQLFNETVTTEAGQHGNSGALAYNMLIDAQSIIVTFDGIDYQCSRIDNFGYYYYGGLSTNGPDFSDYPFLIESKEENGNTVYTETAGTHTVAITVPALQTSTNFAEAVSAIIGGAFYSVVDGATTWAQVVEAMGAGKLVLISWANAYDDNAEPDTQYAGTELVTDAYIDASGNYRISAINVEKGEQSISSYYAATADEPLM